MEIALSILIGVSLSATSGYRVFVPFLVASAAALAGHLELTPNFAWIGTWPALIIFAAATLVEIAAYFIPWVDNALKAINTPVSVVAGTVLTLSVIGGMTPLLRWSLALIAGGGTAFLSNAVSTILHAGTTAASGGAANPILSFFESLGSLLLAVLAIIAPFIAVVLLMLVIYGTVRLARRFRSKRKLRGQ